MKSALLTVIAYYYIVGTLRCEENKTENAKPQKIEENIEFLHLPSTITVEEAIKYLEKAKETHPAESVLLIKELQLIKTTFNITKLELDNGSSRAKNASGEGKPGRIERVGFLDKPNDGYAALKQAIMSHWSFTTTVPSQIQEAADFEQNVKEGYEFKEDFLKRYNLTLDVSI